MKNRKSILVTMLSFLISSSGMFAQDVKESKYDWMAPGGRYVDPTSFFSMHGYVNAVFAGPSPEWTQNTMNGIGMPGQVIVPNTNNSSFQNDEAIWINSELDERTSLLMELHLVTSPSGVGAAGPGGLTFVLTEALANFKIYKNYLNASFGTFWSPFGIQNKDWLGAQNLFSLVPMASGAYVTHFNEKGVRIDGVLIDKEKWGMSYVMGFGNGYNAWDISGYTSWDLNENKSFNGRLSLYPGFGEFLEVGLSYSRGDLNNGDFSLPVSDMLAYDQSMVAYGVDLKFEYKKLKYRAYLISSDVDLQGATDSHSKTNFGAMNELSVTIPFDKVLKEVVPKIRYDYLQQKVSFPGMNSVFLTGVSAGLNFKINNRFTFAADYNWLLENVESDNNRMIIRVSAEF